jgi:hypothetical protein
MTRFDTISPPNAATRSAGASRPNIEPAASKVKTASVASAPTASAHRLHRGAALARAYLTRVTGIGAKCTTCRATEPSKNVPMAPRPCDAITIWSAP